MRVEYACRAVTFMKIERGERSEPKVVPVAKPKLKWPAIRRKGINIVRVRRETYAGSESTRLTAILIQKELDLCPGNRSCTCRLGPAKTVTDMDL